MDTLRFSKTTNFTGRNGYFKASGITVSNVDNSKIMLVPLTSKGKEANCDITIPMDDVAAFITMLRNYLPQNTIRNEKAGNYLACDFDEIDKQIDLVEVYLKHGGREHDLLSSAIDCVWEPLESSLCIGDFLDLIK